MVAETKVIAVKGKHPNAIEIVLTIVLEIEMQAPKLESLVVREVAELN